MTGERPYENVDPRRLDRVQLLVWILIYRGDYADDREFEEVVDLGGEA